jgi:hypothetical protein
MSPTTIAIYKDHAEEALIPENLEDRKATFEMIRIIDENLDPIEFENKWKEYPNYMLEFCGPYSSECQGGTALKKAIAVGNLKLARYVISKIDLTNINRLMLHNISTLADTVFDLFTFRNKPNMILKTLESIRLLLTCGADANCKNSNYTSTLRMAAELKHVEITKLLIIHGAKKFYYFENTSKTTLVKEKFEGNAERTYQLAKESIKKDNFNKCLFLFAFGDELSLPSILPKEVIAKIITSTDMPNYSPYALELRQIKQQLKGQKSSL